jgi:heavy metal translocating P-type ATPase
MIATRDHCDFCGLPLAGSIWGGSRAAQDAKAADPPVDKYCCFGCRFAAAVTRERGEAGAIRWTLTRLGLSIFLSMNVLAFTMALWTNDMYGGDEGGALAASMYGLFRYVCLLLSLPVLIMLGGPLLENAWQALRRGSLSTDLLLLSGVVAAFACSVVSVVRDHGPIYFEVACVILVMVTLGRWFEAAGRLRAGAALDDLQKLLPENVRVLRDGAECQIATASLVIGDQIRLLPGERFPVDGRLVRNSASVDEQILTGESRPVTRHPGDAVCAGTLNLDGDVLVATTLPPGFGSLQRLIELVRQAREAKGHYQELADRLSALVFPVVAAIALATFVGHWLASGLEAGLMAGLAVVLVACPCALGLATPLAVWAALGNAARRQVLFRNGQALERLADIRAIRFDKTGTLTTGDARVSKFLAAEIDVANRATIVQKGASLGASSLHPFSRAIVAYARLPCLVEPVTHVRQIPGRGLTGVVDGDAQPAYLGSRSFMQESGLSLSDSLNETLAEPDYAGSSVACLGWEGCVRGAFVFAEDLRPSALPAVTWCRDQGLDVAVLTGDHRQRADRLAQELNVPVFAELLPEQKLAAIREVHDRVGPVAMVGDGINDAPALAASDVGIALGCGTDVSRDSAAVCLLGNDLLRLTWAIEFAREAVRVMRRNLIWAFAYNAVGIALAAGGWLNPALAALLMVVSSGLVIRSSLSLQGNVAENSGGSQ